MTVRMVATIKRFIGLSADVKPIDDIGGDRVGDGSTFFESNTGNMYIYEGGNWHLKDMASIVRLEYFLGSLCDEAKKTNEYLEVVAGSVSD